MELTGRKKKNATAVALTAANWTIVNIKKNIEKLYCLYGSKMPKLELQFAHLLPECRYQIFLEVSFCHGNIVQWFVRLSLKEVKNVDCHV